MTPEPAAPPNESIAARAAAFDDWLDTLLADVLRARPVDATFLGDHTHDHALPNYSREGDTDFLGVIADSIRALDAIPAGGFDEGRRYDRMLALGQLHLWHAEAAAPCFQAGNPAFHTTEAIAAITALLPGAMPPSDEALAATTARLQAIPAFLETARMRMRSAPLVWTELAMRQTDAGAVYLGASLPTWLQEHERDLPEVRMAARAAADAFLEHAAWLRNVLAERRIPLPIAGNDALDRYLHRGHLLPAAQSPDWWFEFAHAELIEATGDLRELARAIDWRSSARTLLQRLADLHPGADEYDATFATLWERCRAIAIDGALVTWPDLPVTFQPTPMRERALWDAIPFPRYRITPLAPQQTASVTYPVLDRTLPDDAQTRFLRQMNDARILLELVVRGAGLGHHVQSAFARAAPTRIGRLAAARGSTRRLFFCGNAVSEGWAGYATELMEEAGVLTPLQRLAEADRRLRVAARAVADIGMHTGEFSLVRVARMYRDEVGMTATQAMEQAMRDSMAPGIGMSELVGSAGIDELRRAIEERDGAGFDLRAFHDGVLAHGAIPVTLIAASMLAPES